MLSVLGSFIFLCWFPSTVPPTLGIPLHQTSSLLFLGVMLPVCILTGIITGTQSPPRSRTSTGDPRTVCSQLGWMHRLCPPRGTMTLNRSGTSAEPLRRACLVGALCPRASSHFQYSGGMPGIYIDLVHSFSMCQVLAIPQGYLG